jgi:PAS domain S-box-containing protein/putative nucleotidyltransferase with HDIG domain
MTVKKTEAKSQEYAESIINTVREPLIVLDHNLRVVTASRSFYDFFKVKPEETAGQLIYDLGNGQWNIPKLWKLLEDILPQKTTFDNYEVQHDFAAIGKRIMLLNARQIHRVLGKEHIILLAIEDITERRQLENLLTDSEERYRHLFETSSDGIVFLEQNEGKINHANPASEKMLGYTKKELIGNKLLDIGVLLDMGDFQTTKQLLNRSGFLNYNDVPVKTKSGRQMDTDIYLVNRATLLQCSIRDVTERKQAQEALRESEEKFRVLADSTPAAVMLYQDDHWIYANRAAETICGYSEKELLSMNFWNIVHPDFKALIQEHGRLRQQGEETTIRYEFKIITKDGTQKWVDLSGTSTMLQGRPAGIITVLDITDRKKAEEAIKDAQTRYRLLFEHSPDGIVIIDPDTARILEFNETAHRQLGYSREEFARLCISDLKVSETPEEIRLGIAKVIKEGRADFETLQRTRQGEIRNVHVTALITEILGKPVYHCIWRDITDRKRMEEALKESEKKYRLLADNVHDVIFVLDMNLNYTYVSPSTKILRGFEPEEVMKQPPSKALTPSSWDLVKKTVAEAMQLKKEHRAINTSWTLQLEVIRKDGSTLWTEVNISVIRDENQQPVGLLGVTRDIAERKQAEEALRDSEEQYRLVVENAKESIFIVQDIKIVFVNSAAIGMAGYSKEILTSKSFTDFVHPDDLNMVVDYHLRRIKGDEVPPVYSIRIIGQDGTVIWCELNAAVIQWKGKPATLAFLTNITQRKKADEELQKTLERLKQAFGSIVGVMVSAVEMRDPYTAGHQLRVSNLACAIANEMGLPNDKIEGLRMAGFIHDIGKLSIPAEILSKPTKLTDIEFSLIKEHSKSGYEMLKNVESPWPLAQIVYQHHERMNGSGYPRKLKGDEILMEARIIAVADVVEAMASHRPYRPTLGIEATLEEIENNKGILYDNDVADACLRLFREKGYQLT